MGNCSLQHLNQISCNTGPTAAPRRPLAAHAACQPSRLPSPIACFLWEQTCVQSQVSIVFPAKPSHITTTGWAISPCSRDVANPADLASLPCR